MATSHQDDLRRRLNRHKAKRLKQEADDRIEQVEEILGLESNPTCSKCKSIVTVSGHTDDCVLRRINPDSLDATIQEVRKKAVKEQNKQRIFKNSGRKWSGLPGGTGKTTVRKRRSKNRGPIYEMRYCHVCSERRTFILKGEQWICNICEHTKPCSYNPVGRNCKICH